MTTGSEIIQLRVHPARRAGDSRISLCSTCGFYPSCAWAHLDHLLTTRRSSVPSKITLFEEGDRLDAVTCVLAGQIVLSKALRDGRRQILGFVHAGELFGTDKGDVAQCTAVTLTRVELCRIDRAQFHDVLVHSSSFMEMLYDREADQLALAREHLLLLGRRTAEERLATFIVQMQDRCGSRRIDLPLTRQDIGDYLGLTLETVSRTFTKLARRKLIAIIPDGVRVLKMDELRGLAEC